LEGGWIPNWRFDAICLEESLARKIATEGFAVDLRDVAWEGPPPGSASQIVAPTVGKAWFDAEELRARAEDRHGVAGTTCSSCGTWRWMPMTYSLLPPVTGEVLSSSQEDVIASPEWFGDGCQSYRQVIVRRRLAELISAESPRDFRVQELPKR
jgi:hypothetical protein